MTARKLKALPSPDDLERHRAGKAALALRAVLHNPALRGTRAVMHVDLARPRRGVWYETWSGLPGFVRIDGRSYRHDLLPGWEYARDEIVSEMIPDLETLAERGVRPSVPTRGMELRA